MKNILITSAGRRVSLVNAFKSTAIELGLDVKVFITDLNPYYESPTSQFADKSFKIGFFSETNYVDDLLKICLENDIKIVVPTIDAELKLLALSKNKFNEHGIKIIVSDSKLIAMLGNKFKTNIFFKNLGIKTPKILTKDNLDFPVFLKPVNGSNSKGIYKAENINEIRPCDLDSEEMMILKYLDNSIYDEYTIDLYYDKTSILKCVVPRIRLKVVGGESNQGITKKNYILNFVKEKFNFIEGAIGCLTLQLFSKKSDVMDIYGIEINPRFGGGYPFSYNAGANFIDFILREYSLFEDIQYFEDWKDNCLNLRYENEVVIND